MDFTNEKCVMLIDDSLPLGLIEFPIPILKAPPERIKAIREALYEDEFAYLTVVDFSNLAQGCKTYSEFIEKMAQTDEAALSYLGIALCGNKKKMNKLTGSLPLLRENEKGTCLSPSGEIVPFGHQFCRRGSKKRAGNSRPLFYSFTGSRAAFSCRARDRRRSAGTCLPPLRYSRSSRPSSLPSAGAPRD